MKLRSLTAALALALAMTGPVHAQDTLKLAQDYVSMPGVQKMMTDMFSPAALLAQFENGLPGGVTLRDDQRERIATLLSDAMQQLRPLLTSQMVEGAAKNFTVDELKALIAFYGSEHGASVMTKMQPYMQDVMVNVGPELNRAMQKITPEISKIIQEQ